MRVIGRGMNVELSAEGRMPRTPHANALRGVRVDEPDSERRAENEDPGRTGTAGREARRETTRRRALGAELETTRGRPEGRTHHRAGRTAARQPNAPRRACRPGRSQTGDGRTDPRL